MIPPSGVNTVNAKHHLSMALPGLLACYRRLVMILYYGKHHDRQYFRRHRRRRFAIIILARLRHRGISSIDKS